MDSEDLSELTETVMSGWIDQLPDDADKLMGMLETIGKVRNLGLLDKQASNLLFVKVLERIQSMK